jgi:hypothetical protein
MLRLVILLFIKNVLCQLAKRSIIRECGTSVKRESN